MCHCTAFRERRFQLRKIAIDGARRSAVFEPARAPLIDNPGVKTRERLVEAVREHALDALRRTRALLLIRRPKARIPSR
jgi:hypothetical protein